MGTLSTERSEKLNPYASPAIPGEHFKLLMPEDKWPLLRIQVVDVQKQAMRRRVVLAGDVEAEICYDGWAPSELVTVNGLKRFRGSVMYFSLVCPTIRFEVETNTYRVPALLNAGATFSLSTFLRLKKFEIVIGGRLVYGDNG